MAFEKGKIAYLIFHGYGFVSERIQTSTITNVTNVFGDIYDVEMLYTPTASIPAMEPQVGSRVVLDNYQAGRNIPDGEYTIITADDAITRVTVRGRFPVAPTVGAAGIGRLRFEDFYKFSNAPAPAFVTGAEAQARWITNISQDGLSLTLGQKIDIIKAGFASVDGASVELVYNTNPIFLKLISFLIDTLNDTGNVLLATDRMERGVAITGPLGRGLAGAGVTPFVAGYRRTLPTDITIDFGNTNPLPASILADSGAAFENKPVWLNQEALIIYDDIAANNNSGNPVRRVDAIRGVLRTNAALHAPGTVLINGLPGAEGQVIQLLTITDDALFYDDEVEEFFGICENVVFDNNQNSVVLELSDISLTGFRQKFAAKITDRIVSNNFQGRPDETHSITVLSENNFIAESNAAGNWRWIKLGKACIRLEDRTRDITDPTIGAYVDQITPIIDDFGTAVYETFYSFYSVFQGANSSGEPVRYDDWFIVEHSTNLEDQAKYLFPKLNGTTRDGRVTFISGGDGLPNPDSSYLIQSNPFDRSKQYVDDTDTVGIAALNPSVVCLDTREDAPNQLTFQLAHLFEQPEGTIDTPYPTLFSLQTQRFQPGFNRKLLPAGIIMLQVLTSGDGLVGGSPNGPFDVLPYNVGLGIPLDRIDLASFGVLFDEATSTYTFDPYAQECRIKGANLWAQTTFVNTAITIDDTENIVSWLNKNILTPLAVGVSTTTNAISGLKTIRAFSFASIQPNDPDVIDFINTNHTIKEENIYKIAGESIQTSMETKGTDIVESVSYRYWRLTDIINRTKPTQITQKAVPVEAISGTDDIASYARLFTYIQSRPILEELKLYPAHEGFISRIFGEEQIARIGRQRIQQYSSILPKLKFYTDIEESKTGTTKIAVGDRVSIDGFSAVIDTQTGERGVTNLGYCIAQKTDVLRGIIENEVILLGAFSLQLSRWAPSGEIDAVTSTLIFDFAQNIYTQAPERDAEKFSIGDEVLLYDENFVLLSEDGAGNPDPQTIANIVGDQITLNSPFTDGAGLPILPVITNIVLLAEKTLQPIATQRKYGYQNDDETTWI